MSPISLRFGEAGIEREGGGGNLLYLEQISMSNSYNEMAS